ncbi:hypothetical protein ACQUFE_18135, partial [Enterococcus casseliflavus]|uniref:hypothetical protein n=1 Tax=Enterococcus casseliflavus TaxID=37734 RepID=UPI003D0E9DF4
LMPPPIEYLRKNSDVSGALNESVSGNMEDIEDMEEQAPSSSADASTAAHPAMFARDITISPGPLVVPSAFESHAS